MCIRDSLYDELNYFKDKGKKLSPKVVFLQIGAFNDFMNIREHQPSLFRTAMMVDNDPFRDRFHNLFACAQHRPVMVDQKQQAAGRNMRSEEHTSELQSQR